MDDDESRCCQCYVKIYFWQVYEDDLDGPPEVEKGQITNLAVAVVKINRIPKKDDGMNMMVIIAAVIGGGAVCVLCCLAMCCRMMMKGNSSVDMAGGSSSEEGGGMCKGCCGCFSRQVDPGSAIDNTIDQADAANNSFSRA